MTQAKILAARLVAEDKLSNAQIGRKCGVTARCIEKWKRKPEFLAEVASHKKAWKEQVLAEGLSDRAFRVKEAQADYDKLGQIIVERGKDPSMKGVPGGKTGLITRTLKSLNKGDGQRTIVPEYEADHGIVQARAHIREQVARELGQWVEEVKHSGQINVVKRLIGVSEDEI